MTEDIPTLDRSGLRKFGITTGVIILLLFFLLLPWLFNKALPLWPWVLAGILWFFALLIPTALGPVYKVWMKIGHVLGWINTRIILGIMFYVMFVPFGLVMKLFGKDPMARKLDTAMTSYRIISKKRSSNHLEKPY